MRESSRRTGSERPAADDAPEAAFDVAPELFGAAAAAGVEVGDDTAG